MRSLGLASGLSAGTGAAACAAPAVCAWAVQAAAKAMESTDRRAIDGKVIDLDMADSWVNG